MTTTPGRDAAADYRTIERLVAHLANKHHARFGGDPDDIFSDAQDAAWKACCLYQPAKGALTTYVQHCVTNRLITLERRRARRLARERQALKTYFFDGVASARSPEPPDCLSRRLSADARLLLALILRTPDALAAAFGPSPPPFVAGWPDLPPHREKGRAMRYLRGAGWSRSRWRRAVREASTAVGGGAEND